MEQNNKYNVFFVKVFSLFAMVLLITSKTLMAQTEERKFRNISIDKGLSQSTVFAIKQDTLGFIWMGTQDGLNRYDSKGFKVYRPVNGNKNTLNSYYIRSLFIDHKGSLWVGGNQGVSRYDYSTDSFQNFTLPRSLGEWYISSITEDLQHNIWATSIVGAIFKLSAGASEFKQVNVNIENSGIKRTAYIGLWNQKILIGTEVGLFFIGKNNELDKIDLGVDKPAVNDVYIDKNTIWVGTEGQGLIKYDFGNKQVQPFLHSPVKNSISDNNVRCVGRDADGNIWLGTFRGLSILNAKTLIFENYYHQISQPYTISQNSVRCFYKDKQDGIWLGTYYGGANYYHKNDIKFNLLSQNTGKPSLNDEVISVIKQDWKGNFWIGTNDNGLNYWDRENNSIRYFSNSESNKHSLSANNVKTIAFIDNGNLLVGTHNGGMNLLNPSTGFVKRFKHNDNDPNSIAGDLVYTILKDYKNRIWVGTRSGLDLFDVKSQTFTHIHLDRAGKRLSSDDIVCMFEDSQHRIWIGTTNGTTLFYPDNMLFGIVGDGKLSEDVVNCITEDQKHRIWLGTREGLKLYNETQKSFTDYKTRKDFIKETIYGIIPDNENNLWISTNVGLVKFNPDKKTTQVFDESDGLQNNQFNEYAFCKAKDGMMLFGGIKGISYFYPSSIKQQPLPLKLKFTGLEVFNKMVSTGDETHILENHIDQTQELELAPEYKQFSLHFNTFNYISSNRTHYYYRLQGSDTEWQRTDNLKVTYNNLNAGNYTFEIKAVGPSGETSEVRSLKIIMLPPWYNAPWFYLLMICLIIIGSYVAYRIISERIKTLHQLKLERVDKEKVRYINQVKMDFFTNVSHELRTPLTLILAPIEELIKKHSLDKAVNKKLEIMQLNAKRLYNLVDQLFEFKKAELGTRTLKVGDGDLVSFINEIYVSFKPLSERNDIVYTYHSSRSELLFPFDKDALEKILFNLLSNAFKYTKPGDAVNIDLDTKNEFVIIKITDTGLGIAEEDLPRVFERFYQVNNSEMNLGSGVGLAFTKRLVEIHHGEINVESTPGEGSVFTVKIPMAESFYADDFHIETTKSELPLLTESSEVLLDEIALPQDTEEDDMEEIKDMKLLVVDDNNDVLEYLKDFLGQNYQISTASDGKIALEILEKNQFDLIVSDIMMPELDGLHFCKRVKQNINTSHIPVILLTARSETSQQVKGLEMGADDYVTKPFSSTLLSAKIANLLRSRKRLKEFYSSSKEIIPENIAFNTLDEEFLKEAIAIIELHLSDSEFSVDKFSREIGMSRSNLYLKLKAITGESATDFLKRIRFKKAVELMQSKRYTIAQITYMCGFNSPSYFSTAFKQYHGCMPSEYLLKMEQNEEL